MKKSLKNTITYLFLFFFRILRIKFKNTNGTVIVFRHDELGDLILWLSAAAELRKFYSKERIVLIGNPTFTQFTELCPYWDEVYNLDLAKYRNSPIYRLKTLWKISSADIIINPLLGRPFYIDLLIGLSIAKQRIGIKTPWSEITLENPKVRELGNSYYTKLIDVDLKLHILTIHQEFVSKIVGHECVLSMDQMEFIPGALSEAKRKYLVIVPGAGGVGKRWETAKFAEVLNAIFDKYDIFTIICGTKSENILAKDILKQVHHKDRIIDKTGKTDFVELVNIIRSSILVIGNDTGTIHISANLKIPTVCIYGGGHFGIYHPYPQNYNNGALKAIYTKSSCFNCMWYCDKALALNMPFPCISAVEVKDVWNAVDGLLKNTDCRLL